MGERERSGVGVESTSMRWDVLLGREHGVGRSGTECGDGRVWMDWRERNEVWMERSRNGWSGVGMDGAEFEMGGAGFGIECPLTVLS